MKIEENVPYKMEYYHHDFYFYKFEMTVSDICPIYIRADVSHVY